MRNCIVLGSGRSGTSMTAGMLNKSGYFMGDNLNPANETNPKGQFEDREINEINEELLMPVTPKRPAGRCGELFFKTRPVHGQRWLARIPTDIEIPLPPNSLKERMEDMTRRHIPYCFKDPRFSYTLACWRPLLDNPVYVCVFRDPSVTVSSILKQSRIVPHLRNFSINDSQAFQVWELMYSHILQKHYPAGGDWIFLHYDQLIDGSAHERLEEKLGVTIDPMFAEKKLNRSKPEHEPPRSTRRLYEELCRLAHWAS